MNRAASFALVAFVLASGHASASTFVVSNTNNFGPGSLRQAIVDANTNGGPDVITFDIPGPGPFVITVASTLPPFTDGAGVTLDATTQPGYAVRPLIGTGGTVGVDQLALPQIRAPIIQVFGNGLAGDGLSFLDSNNSTLRGLHVWGFTGTNVVFDRSNNASVERNLIGSTTAFGDPGPGLRAARNLLIDRAQNPTVTNNLIGHAATPDNVVVTAQGGRILVDGNELVGTLRIARDSTVSVGQVVPNRFISANLLRDSQGYGLDIVGGLETITVSDNTIRNNGSGGVQPAGVRLTNTTSQSTRNNVLQLNIVTGNQGPGILITGTPDSANRGNAITRNSIYANGGIGIDLGGEASDPLTGDGPTLNDLNDSDEGGNQLINFPVIESATVIGNTLTVSGWSRHQNTIEFFADLPASQGRTFIASVEESSPSDEDDTSSSYGPGPVNGVVQGTDTTNRFRFRIPLPPGFQAGSVLTATATAHDSPQSTSEFGGAVPVALVADVRITKTAPASVTPGTIISYALTVTNDGPNAASAVTVADPTPPGLTFVSTSGACTTPFPCSLATLESGQSVAIVATFAVPASYTTPTPIVNTATVSSTATDPNPANNTATATTQLGAARADLRISKGRPLRRSLGATLEYSIVVTNHGPSDASSVTVADPTPAGLTFVSNTGACTTAFPCSLGTIPAHQSRVILTQFLIPSSYAGPDPIVNTATVSSTATDPDLTNNSATATTAVGPLFTINVEVTKTGPASVTPGTNLVYSITATNNGTLDATDVTVTDPTPVGLTFVSNTGACTTPFPCPLGTLPAGQSRHITATFAVPSGYSTPNPMSNTSTVTTTAADQDLTDNQATVTTSVGAPSTDLAISKTGPASVTPGASLTYTIRVSSNGPSNAPGVTVMDPTPAGLTFVGNTGDCTTAFPCALGTIPAGQARAIQATFAVPPGYAGPSTILNTATVATTATDLDPDNNTSTATATVTPAAADLSITKTGEAEARPGDAISYVMTIANAGPGEAQAVMVDDPTPAGLTFVSNSGACTTPFPCSLGALASGQTRTITATFTVNANTPPGTLVNTASVSSSTGDSLPGNNTSDFATLISDMTPAVADLALTKTTSTGSVLPGGAITYALVATNLGPNEASDVSIADALPAEVSFVSVSPSPGGICDATRSVLGGSVTCVWPALTAIGPSGARWVRLVVRVPDGTADGTSILNTAQVTSASSDPTSQNNSASALTTVFSGVSSSADIEVQKTLPVAPGPDGQIRVGFGQPFAFSIRVVNHGPADATGIVVNDLLPAGIQPVQATAGQGAFDLQTGVWSVGNLLQGGRADLQLVVVAAQSGPFQNTAVRVASQPVDSDAANDRSSVSFIVRPSTAVGCDVDGNGLLEFVTGAGPGGGPHVRVWRITGNSVTETVGSGWFAYDPAFPGGVFVTCGDVTGDGIAETITGAGPGGGPHVRVWSAIGGNVTELFGHGFFAYDPAFPGGVSVAVGDVTGDGIAEIVTGAGGGGDPHVRVVSTLGGVLSELFAPGFLAYDPAFPGGVSVAVGDVTGDGIAEIITGAGEGGGPHVRVWSTTGGVVSERFGHGFFAYDDAFPGGVFVAAGDLTGDGVAEIVTGAGPGGGPHVRVWSTTGGAITELLGHGFFAYDPAFPGGVFVAVGDLTGDGIAEIITGAGPDGGPHVRVWSVLGGTLTELVGHGFFAYDPAFPGGVRVAR